MKRDFSGLEREVTALCWNPGDQSKFAIGFRNQGDKFHEKSVYIADTEKSSKPFLEINTTKNVSVLNFNPKDSSQLLAGFEDGFIILFDIKKSSIIAKMLIHKLL